MNSRRVARSGSAVRVPVNAGAGEPVERQRDAILAGAPERQQRPPLPLGVQLPQALLLEPVLAVEAAPGVRVEQVGHDADDARRVENVHGRMLVRGRDPHRRVLTRRRRAADQERQLEAAALHLLRHVHHLVQRRRDQPGEPDRVGALGDRGVEDLLGRDHHAEVDDVVVVAAEDDADDVLADVVHVALDGRQHDLPLLARGAVPLLSLEPP